MQAAFIRAPLAYGKVKFSLEESMMSGRRARPKRRVKEIERVITPLQARGLEFLLAKGGDVKFQLTPYSKLALGT